MDKFDDLIVDTDRFDEEMAREILVNYIRIGTDGSVRFLPSTVGMTVEKKVLLFLLANKVIEILKDRIVKKVEKITPTVIEEEIAVKGNTLRPVLKKLRDQKLISSMAGSDYSIEVQALPTIKTVFERGNTFITR